MVLQQPCKAIEEFSVAGDFFFDIEFRHSPELRSIENKQWMQWNYWHWEMSLWISDLLVFKEGA